jgi:hypothetical protein
MINTHELAIIAKDGGKLSDIDRALISEAGNELDQLRDELVRANMHLIETSAKLVAVTERLIELQRNPPFTPCMWATKIIWRE